MRTVAKLFVVFGMLASLVAGGVFFLGVAGANGAPQEASASAISLFIVIAPYCLARLLSEWVKLQEIDE